VVSANGEKISHAKNVGAIWLYVRFTLSFRDVEDLLAERGIMVSYETVRRWVNHFGPKIAADLRKRQL
jgi:putative transposase